MYKSQAGPYEVGVARSVKIHLADRDRDLLLRVSYPNQSGVFPLIVFFHGALCSAEGYAALADHWASQGYVVILPSHPDFGGPGSGDPDRQNKTFREQVGDMSSILDSLDILEGLVAPLRQKIDPERVAAAGHSMGALIAVVVGGLPRLEPDGSHVSLKDHRFDILPARSHDPNRSTSVELPGQHLEAELVVALTKHDERPLLELLARMHQDIPSCFVQTLE